MNFMGTAMAGLGALCSGHHGRPGFGRMAQIQFLVKSWLHPLRLWAAAYPPPPWWQLDASRCGRQVPVDPAVPSTVFRLHWPSLCTTPSMGVVVADSPGTINPPAPCNWERRAEPLFITCATA